MPPFYFPLPTALPQDDIEQYKELLLAAVEEYLDLPSNWNPDDLVDALGYMEELKVYIMDLENP